MLEVSISQVVFVTLESVFFLSQLSLLFTKLKSKVIKSFLLANAGIILFNFLILIGGQNSAISNWLYMTVQLTSILVMLGAAWFYLHSLVRSRNKNRVWIVASISAVLIPISFFSVSELSSSGDRVLLSGIVFFLIIITTYSFITLRLDKRKFLAFASLFVAFYALSFILYFANSFHAMVITLNLLFLALGVFHHLLIFDRINIAISSPNLTGRKALKKELSKFNLTTRQIEIAVLVIEGYKSKEIADICHISPGAERKHVSNIIAVLDVSSRSELIRKFDKFL